MKHADLRLPCLFAFALSVAITAKGECQNPPTALELPAQALPLTDLSAFRAAGANWHVVGAAATLGPGAAQLVTTAGGGVLVNQPSSTRHASATTVWEHGDIDVSFDVLLAKGSTPSVLLMSRYGVNLSDSWVLGAPTVSTIGAVMPRWDDARGGGREPYEGTPPRQNAGRAPGLWQHVDIVFRAPKFAAGRKVSNARFAKVSVNGVVVQENVQVTGPTLGAAFRDERASGPLIVDGEHGPLALRNIRYKPYAGALTLTNLRYRVFEGDAMDASYATTHAPTREGTTSAISTDLTLPTDKFAVTYDGSLNAPAAGKYRFSLALGWLGSDSATRGPAIGGGLLSVDGKPVVVHAGAERRSAGDVELQPGAHTFEVSFYKNRASFTRRDISVMVEGPGVERQSITDDNGGAGGGGAGAPVNPIMVEPQAEPVVLRSFIRHRNSKRVIVASVADPRGVHYSYDLAQGSLLYVWRGPFLETTQMWHERGEDQTAEPIGSAVTLPGAPTLAYLDNASGAWPDSLNADQLRRDGYALGRGGHPTFLYRIGAATVEDALRPDADGLSLHRALRIHTTTSGYQAGVLYVQLAQAAHIAPEGNGSYAVGDRAFYIRFSGGGPRPILRRIGGMDELIAPVRFERGEASVAYSIIW